MAVRHKPVGKMTYEELVAEWDAADHRFFSLRLRYLRAEIERRKQAKEAATDGV